MPKAYYDLSVAAIDKEMDRLRRSRDSYRKAGRNKDGSRRMKAAVKRKLQSLGSIRAGKTRRKRGRR